MTAGGTLGQNRHVEWHSVSKGVLIEVGKIRRVELRQQEEVRAKHGERGANEFREEDFPELRGA